MARKKSNKKKSDDKFPPKKSVKKTPPAEDDQSGKETLKTDMPAEAEKEKPSAPDDAGFAGIIKPKPELTPEEVEEGNIDEEEDDSTTTKTCRCQEVDGDYYCFKLKQGRWEQWSVVPYPTKKICEAACCNN